MNSVELVIQMCKDRGIPIAKLERDLGFANGYIRKLKEGKFPSDRLQKIADYLNIEIGSLMLIDGKRYDDVLAESLFKPASARTYPVLGEVACGQPIVANDEHEVLVSGSSVRADAVVIAKGDSMVGARICDGDTVFIRYQEDVENGEIACVVIESDDTHDYEIVMKRFYKYADDLVVLHSENPAYKDMVFRGEDLNRLRILGKAVAFQSDL